MLPLLSASGGVSDGVAAARSAPFMGTEVWNLDVHPVHPDVGSVTVTDALPSVAGIWSM